MRTLTLGLLAAAALATGLLLARSQTTKHPPLRAVELEPATQEDEASSAGTIFVDRLRALGI